MKVTICSTVDVFYYSFYIEGFYKIFGKKNFKFSSAEFPVFSSRTLAAIINQNGKEIRVVIDALDTSKVYSKPLGWCDVYGKVNLNEGKITFENTHKIIALGPSFGIRIWSFANTLKFALLNYNLSKGRINNEKYFFTSYWRQYKRLPLNKYTITPLSSANYVFFVSSLWKKEGRTNELRANFIRICKELEDINFEGGFAPRSDNDDLSYTELIGKRISLNKYLDKIKGSFVVFNTPAVQGCHGWKLAEFMALGKAIISTDITNILPAPIENRKHLHFVSSSKGEIKSAIQEILQDHEYRNQLEKNSRKYYIRNLQPEVVIKKLLVKAQND